MNIWIPKCKILEPRRELMMPAVGLKGRFKLEVYRPDGRRRLLVDWFDNLITNAGLNNIGTGAGWLAAARVGTGSTTPAVTDTGMAALLAGAFAGSVNIIAQPSAPYFGTSTIPYRFAAGDAAGNLAEVGIATQTTAGGTQFSRALILDGDGNPTTITVLSDEVLDVTYQLQFLAQTSDVTDTITIGGIDYDIVSRACDVTSAGNWGLNTAHIGGPATATAFTGTIGAVTASDPSGTSFGAEQNTLSSYSADSYFRESTQTWGLTFGNAGGAGLRSISFPLSQGGGMGKAQVSFANDDSPSVGIPKNSSTVLSLVARHTWARGTAVV